MTTSKWLTPKQIFELTFISASRLRYYRHKGYLKNVKQSPGSSKHGGRTLYDLQEVKEVFLLN